MIEQPCDCYIFNQILFILIPTVRHNSYTNVKPEKNVICITCVRGIDYPHFNDLPFNCNKSSLNISKMSKIIY